MPLHIIFLTNIKKIKRVKYFDKLAWLMSVIWDFKKDNPQKTTNPKYKSVVVSNFNTSIELLFFSKRIMIKSKKTLVSSCLANKKGSNIELKKTKGSEAK